MNDRSLFPALRRALCTTRGIGFGACAAFLVVVAGCGPDAETPSAPAPEGVAPTAAPASPAPGLQEAPTAPRPAALPPAPPADVRPVGPYQADHGRDCDGWPRLALETPPATCVGIVAHATHPAIAAAGPRFRPRSIVQDPARDDVFWIIDGGAQRDHAGRVFRLRTALRPGEPPAVHLVLTRLHRPHGGRVGPDGKVYVGEVDGIFRFDPTAVNVAIDGLPPAPPGPQPVVAVAREAVVSGLATQLRREDRIRYHPLSAFVFTPGGDLIVNRGSSTDRCLESLPAARCEDEADDLASLVRYAYLGAGRYATEPEVLARGLRNSVALVAHASGTLLQGENGADFQEADRPHEELNVIVAGGHYGWPYCFDARGRDPSWAHSDFHCDPARNLTYHPPLRLLPPHGAPLGLAYYDHPAMPMLTGHLLVSLHGYRAAGHRLLALPVNARGLPPAHGGELTLLGGWDASERGPKGAPVELWVARDGSVWLVEDKNGTVLRIAAETYAPSADADPHASSGEVVQPPDAVFAGLRTEVLGPRCGACHAFLLGPPGDAAQALRHEGWLALDGDTTALELRITRRHERPMPPAAPLPADELARIRAWLAGQR
ncbi:MAG: PQQ-dependent sugar dehydrogenase [Sandaracinaceae bacterium]|nr:PQQ-dependent sugar dehydrogenase [Sandaracinaceae bacterium]MBP7685123.1 PQQ-dependent sugar dehydrogenase [Deltaproteobacteria bacterium]MBK6813459.1 PQQ-dependent sugar dehydrogenase [Sandaracinaceae bacterium]MBK7152964.1 PQQ-dependent sugar dehydrogenase [Sandaracinaceae bacterium]MBK8411099.1 PQQ-dependent sugar dehydrogenase [Sandaracinaceae bacterium]